MKLGDVTVSFRFLEARLPIPAGHTIVAVVPPDAADVGHRTLRLLIEGPDMNEQPEGAPIERRRLIYEARFE